MEHVISMRWLANLVLIKAVVDFLINSGAHMNIAFMLKVKILALIKQSDRSLKSC